MADYVVIESTYGTRLHGPRPDYVGQLSEIIESTFDKGGNVVIPSFAVGRTQELLYLFRYIKENNILKRHNDFSVWVDSPLAVDATAIYINPRLKSYFDQETLALVNSGVNPIFFRDCIFRSPARSQRLLTQIRPRRSYCRQGNVRGGKNTPSP